MTDSTRPHPRIQKLEAEGKRVPLSVGTLYLPPKIKAHPRTPLIVHFHGAPWLIEYHVLHHAPRAALVWLHLGAGSRIYEETFADASRFSTLLSEAGERLREATGRETAWSRVTLTSFSAGYGAVRAILRHPAHFERVDAVLLADSLHSSYMAENDAQKPSEAAAGKTPKLDRDSLESFARFAQDAARGKKRMWVTHSEVYPGTFASTTETADYLIERLAAKRKAVLRRGPVGMQQLSEVSLGGFSLAGFAGNSAPDHMDHFYALGQWLARMGTAKK